MTAPALPRGLWRTIHYELDCKDVLQIWGTCKELSGSLDKIDIAASAFALTRPRLSATSPLALEHWVKVMRQCMETGKVEDWAQSMLIHTEEDDDDDDDDDDDHFLVSWPAPEQHSPFHVLELIDLVHGACPSLRLDSHILAMSCMVLIGPSCTSQSRIHMRALCLAEGVRYQVWEFVWRQLPLIWVPDDSSNLIRDIAVCNVDNPADGIAVFPSISGRLDFWGIFQHWHTSDENDDWQWLPCFYDPALRAPLTISNTVKITDFFHPHDAARPVKKQAKDSIVYTCGEFIHWYGTHLGRHRWLEAESEDEQSLKEILRKAFPCSIND